MRLSDLMRRAALVTIAALLLMLGSTGPALAVEPTPEQKAQAARTAAERLCKDGILGAVLLNEAVREGCSRTVAVALVDHGRNLTTQVLCSALTGPAGPVVGSGLKRVCIGIGLPLVNQAISLFEDALKVAGFVIDVVKFVADPTSALDNFANTLKTSATDLVDKVLRELSGATAFNAKADWWLKHYAASAGLGLLVMAIMLLITAVQTARNQLSGDEMHDTVFKHLPTGLLLMIFGPPMGGFLAEFSDTLTNGIIKFIAPDMGAFLGKAGALGVLSGLTSAVPGGVIIGIIIYLMVFLGALALLAGLLLQTLTLYFTGLACAIGFGMWVNPKWRKKAARIPLTWLGILLAKPLLFLLLGAAFGLANFAASTTNMSDGLKGVTTALMAALALLVAGLAPFTLLKYAPLLPDGSDSVGGTGGGALGGAVTGTASAVANQIAMRRAMTNNDAAKRQEASVGGNQSPTSGTDRTAAPTDPTRRTGDAEPAKTTGTDPARTTSGTDPATATGATETPGATTPATTTPATTTTSAASSGKAASTAGAGATKAGTAGAGAATGGVALGVIAAAEIGRAAVDKARSIADNAAPDIPAKDGD